MREMFGRIQELVQQHVGWRNQCMNLIAAENALSPVPGVTY